MENLTIDQKEYLQKYLDTLAPNFKVDTVCASVAGDERNADELLDLYLSGKKHAGSSMLEDFNFCNEPLPKSGDLWIVLDSNDKPKCILKSIRIEQNKFMDVPVEVAIAEGEGDLTLEYWREAHIQFFYPYIHNWGLEFVEDSTIITEYYELVFKS